MSAGARRWTVRLAEAAETDFQEILRWTSAQFGEAQARVYAETLSELRAKHGKDLEDWWIQTFGYGFDRLTESEARYLLRSPDADTIRARILAAKQAAQH